MTLVSTEPDETDLPTIHRPGRNVQPGVARLGEASAYRHRRVRLAVLDVRILLSRVD